MLTDVVEVRPRDGYLLYVRFEDGVEGVIDLQKLVQFEGVFAALRQRSLFEQVRVNPELGAICWPTGADLDADVLHALLSGQPISSFAAKKA
ncbi:MAG TPA: DUF2442 domain-containing protein [Bryobacteraceae bacterium]|nr:DUF2442 domain-containing protein [Bryobacteraceae bacterium]